jgi:hypothetical protein
MKAVIIHTGFGCDTGCCGHSIKVGDFQAFEFDHPYGEDTKEWAEQRVREFCEYNKIPIAEIDWEASEICDD